MREIKAEIMSGPHDKAAIYRWGPFDGGSAIRPLHLPESRTPVTVQIFKSGPGAVSILGTLDPGANATYALVADARGIPLASVTGLHEVGYPVGAIVPVVSRDARDVTVYVRVWRER